MPQFIFQVNCSTELGEDVRLVGSASALGTWMPSNAVRMQTGPDTYPLWKSEPIPLLEPDVEYKYVVVKTMSEGEARWEECPNRRIPSFSTFDCTNKSITVEEHFGDDKAQNMYIAAAAPKMKTKPMPEPPVQPVITVTPASPQTMQPLKQVGSSIFFPPLDDDMENPLSPKTPKSPFSPKTPTISTMGSVNLRSPMAPGTCSFPTISETQASEDCIAEELTVTWPHSSWIWTVELVGSFTDPPWQQKIEMALCEINQVWRVSLLEAAPRILDRPCDLEFKFIINGSSRCVNEQMRRHASEDGDENNVINITEDLIHQLERSRQGDIAETGTLTSVDSSDKVGCPRLHSGSIVMDMPIALYTDAHCKPKDTSKDGGEDAFFIHDRMPALGIADGVGDLEKYLGHSSRAFAEQLMKGCEEVVTSASEHNQTGPPSKTAMEICKQGYKKVSCHGACTALVAFLDSDQHRLGVASLGDSGLMVVRRCHESQKMGNALPDLSIIFKTPAQQHAFNFPFQLCRAPAQMRAKMVRQPDEPYDAAMFDVEVEEGDLVLLYTDGLDDNLSDDEILQHLNGLPQKVLEDPKQIAEGLVSAAYRRSHDDEAETPFGQQARLAGWPEHHCRGGKQDDITCVAAWVTGASQYSPMGQNPGVIGG